MKRKKTGFETHMTDENGNIFFEERNPAAMLKK